MKKELSNLKHIQKEIEIIQEEIGKTTAEYTTDKVSGSMSEYPYTKKNFIIEGYNYDKYYARLKRLEKKLSRKLEELMDERDRISEYIEKVKDPTIRVILRLRHINGMTWEQVGREIGYSTRHVKRKYYSFLNKQK